MSVVRTKSQNAKRSRAKGHAWERVVASALRTRFPAAERCIAQSRTAAREGCDVEGTPWWIECKVGGAVSLDAALAQAERDTDGRPALVVAKSDFKEPVVFCRLSTIWTAYEGRVDVPISMTLARFMDLLGDPR